MTPDRATPETDQSGDPGPENRRLRLYVAGATAQSARAVETVTDVCSEALADRHELEIIDVHQLRSLGERDAVRATPTLVVATHEATRRVVLLFRAASNCVRRSATITLQRR